MKKIKCIVIKPFLFNGTAYKVGDTTVLPEKQFLAHEKLGYVKKEIVKKEVQEVVFNDYTANIVKKTKKTEIDEPK